MTTRPVQIVIIVQGLCLGIAVGLGIDGSLTPHAYAIDPLVALGGGFGGGVIGALIAWRWRVGGVQVWPVWAGFVAAGLCGGGIFAIVTATLPLDYRPLVAATLAATLPGTLGGLGVGARMGRDMTASRARTILDAQTRQVVAVYTNAEGQVFAQDDDTYITRIVVPRTRESIIFYFTCDSAYPVTAPLFVGVESVVPDGGTQEITYSPPILNLWNARVTLQDIIDEALHILIR